MTDLALIRSAGAEEDLIEIWSHVAAFSETAADRLLDRFERRWELLTSQPYSGAAREDIAPGLRHVVVGEYLSLYRVTEEAILIVRVLHGRRDLSGRAFD